MGSSDHLQTVQRVDAAIHYTGLFVRALAYAAIGMLAGQYDCGNAVLTGVVIGDVASRFVALTVARDAAWLPTAAELVLLCIICLLLRSRLDWPADQAMRAITCLCAFGVFAAQAGGSLLTRLGPSEDGFA